MSVEASRPPLMAPGMAEAERVLLQRFGFSSFRPGQRSIIEALLGGRDALAVMPTGAGKSLCFQLPALLLRGVTLVVSPLIALMKDQVDGLREQGIAATFINSSISYSEQEARLMSVRTGHLRLLYIAPERFRSRAFLRALRDIEISLFAIDEAHCISQWGHDFRPDYLRLRQAIELLRPHRVLALTATANAAVQTDILQQIPRPGLQKFVGGFDRPNLHFAARRLAKKSEKPRVLIDLVRRLKTGIVYTATRKAAEELVATLAAHGVRAVCYHAGLPANDRREIQDEFMSGSVPVVCATNAFGMGIDKPDIRFVIHYQMPGTIEAYYQEAGRAGRDGHPAECHLLYGPADLQIQRIFIERENPSRVAVQSVYEVLVMAARRHPEALVELTHDEIAQRAPIVDAMAVGTCIKLLETAGHLVRVQRNSNRASIVLEQPEALISERASVKRKVLEVLRDLCGPSGAVEIPLELLARKCELEPDALRRAVHALEADRILHYEPPFQGRGVRLAAPVPSNQLEVDWKALTQKAALAERKLALMKDYVVGNLCRRRYLLEYFGDLAVTKACGNCDQCRHGARRPGKTKSTPESHEANKQLVLKILSCVARLERGHGRETLIDVLRGTMSRPVVEYHLASLSTWALLDKMPEEVLRACVEMLVVGHMIEERGGVVALTEEGWKLIRRRSDPATEYPSLPVPGEPRKRKRRKKSGRDFEDSDFDQDLFEKLRAWRTAEAERQGVPAYCVRNDKQLRALARLKPTTAVAMKDVPGFRERTVKRYGSQLLGIIVGSLASNPSPP